MNILISNKIKLSLFILSNILFSQNQVKIVYGYGKIALF
jgi:hypothetical protein